MGRAFQALLEAQLPPPLPFAIPPTVTHVPGLSPAAVSQAHKQHRHNSRPSPSARRLPHNFAVPAPGVLRNSTTTTASDDDKRHAALLRQLSQSRWSQSSSQSSLPTLRFTKNDRIIPDMMDRLEARFTRGDMDLNLLEILSNEPRPIVPLEMDLSGWVQNVELRAVMRVANNSAWWESPPPPPVASGFYLPGSHTKGSTDLLFSIYSPDNLRAVVAFELKSPEKSKAREVGSLASFEIGLVNDIPRTDVLSAVATEHMMQVSVAAPLLEAAPLFWVRAATSSLPPADIQCVLEQQLNQVQCILYGWSHEFIILRVTKHEVEFSDVVDCNSLFHPFAVLVASTLVSPSSLDLFLSSRTVREVTNVAKKDPDPPDRSRSPRPRQRRRQRREGGGGGGGGSIATGTVARRRAQFESGSHVTKAPTADVTRAAQQQHTPTMSATTTTTIATAMLPTPTLAVVPRDPARHARGDADYTAWQANILVFDPVVPVKIDHDHVADTDVLSRTPSLTHSSPTKAADEAAFPSTPELQDQPLGAAPSWSPPPPPSSHATLKAPSLAPPAEFKIFTSSEATTASLCVTLDSLYGTDGLFDVYDATFPLSTEPISAHVCWTKSELFIDESYDETTKRITSLAEIHAELSRRRVPSAPRFYGLWRGEMDYEVRASGTLVHDTIYVMLLSRNGEPFDGMWCDMTLDQLDAVRTMYEDTHAKGVVPNTDEANNIVVRPDGSYGLANWHCALFEGEDLYDQALESERAFLGNVEPMVRYQMQREEEISRRRVAEDLPWPVT